MLSLNQPNLLSSSKSSLHNFLIGHIPNHGSWFVLGNITCVLHNTRTTTRRGVEGRRCIEFYKSNGKQASVDFIRYSSSVLLRCLKQSGMIKPFTYKYIPRSVQLDSIVRVKKLNKVQGLSTYQLLINGVHWKYCVSNGKVHYHDISVDNAAKNLRLHLDCDKKWFSR